MNEKIKLSTYSKCTVKKKKIKDMTDRSIKIIRSDITKNTFGQLGYGDIKLIYGRMYICGNIQKNIS